MACSLSGQVFSAEDKKRYKSEYERLQSFTRNGWSTAGVQADQLAAAGYVYLGNDDMTWCAWCEHGKKDWKHEDNAIVEHFITNPQCEFLHDAKAAGNIPICRSWTYPSPCWHPERQIMTTENDQLDYNNYARILKDLMVDNQTKPPLTVGIFGNWGQGKTSLLELIENNIEKHNVTSTKEYEEQDIVWKSSFCLQRSSNNKNLHKNAGITLSSLLLVQTLILLCVFALSVACIFLVFYLCNISSQGPRELAQIHLLNATSHYLNIQVSPALLKIIITLIPIVFIVLVLLLFIFCATKPCRNCHLFTPLYKYFISLFFYPILRDDMPKRETIRVINVKFNAWEYAGCDLLWAGIASKICDSVVQYFGKWRCRFYRITKQGYDQAITKQNFKNPQNEAEEHLLTVQENKKRKLDRNGNIISSHNVMHVMPYQHCGIPRHIAVLTLVLFVILLVCLAYVHLKFGTFDKAVTILSSIMAFGSVIAFAKVVWEMIKMYTGKIATLMKLHRSPDLKRGLGAMYKIKLELESLTEMLKFMEWVDMVEYRVVMFIDDLDRCKKSTILEILEAVSIILSNPETRYISVIAIDPRVVVKSVEADLQENVNFGVDLSFANGHDYLKKIIHLPFWLPENQNEKIKRMFGLISDNFLFTGSSPGPINNGNVTPTFPLENQVLIMDPTKKAMALLGNCGNILSNNPRNVKRLVNIVNLALRLWYSKNPSVAAETMISKLVMFLILAEQWPYRLSILVQMYLDKDRGVPYDLDNQNVPLLELFEKHQKLLKLPREWTNLIKYDMEQKGFEDALGHEGLRFEDIGSFLPYMINLDYSLVEIISFEISRFRINNNEPRQ